MPRHVLQTPQLLLECDAAELLILWREAGLAEPLTAVHACGGWKCRITFERDCAIPLIEVPFTDCQTDIVEVLRAGGSMTKGQILAALESQDKLHGESTVGFALANLRDRGVIVSPGRGKRGGYSLKT